MSDMARWFGLMGFGVATIAGCGDSGSTSSGTGGGGGGSTSSTGGAGGGSTTSGTGGGGTPCEQICDKNLEVDAVLMCGYDGTTCVSDCESAFTQLTEGCDDEAIAFNDCLIAQPPEDFTCNVDGTATLGTTACVPACDALYMCAFGSACPT